MTDKQVKIQVLADTENAKKGFLSLNKEVGDFTKETDKAAKSVDNLGKETAEAGNDASKSAKKVSLLTISYQKLRSTVAGIGKASKKSLDIMRTGLEGALAVSTALTVPVIGVAKAYADYEKALIGVGKTANLTGHELKQFGKEFKTATKDIPISTNELLDFAATGARLGVAREDLTKFATTLAKLQVSAEGLSMEEASLSIARTVKLMEGGTENVDRFASTVARLGDEFPVTEGEVLHSSLNIASAVSRFKVSTADVAALATATKSVGIEAENARTQLAKSFQKISDAIYEGGDSLDELMRLTGMTGEQLKQTFEKDATAVFQAYLEGLNKLPQEAFVKSLEEMGMSGERSIQVLGALSRKGIGTLRTALQTANEEYITNTKLTNESEKAFSTLSAQVTLVWKRITDLASLIGEKLAPTFKDTTKRVIEFFDEIENSTAIDQIADAMIIFIELSGDFIRVLGGVAKAIGDVFGINSDSMQSLRLFRKLLQMDTLLETLSLMFAKKAVEIATTWRKLGAIFDFKTFGITQFITQFKNSLSQMKAIAEIAFNELKTAIKIKGLEVAKEGEILAKTLQAKLTFGDADTVRAEVTAVYDARITALRDETARLNQTILEEGQKTIDARNEDLQAKSEALVTNYQEIKTQEAETLLAIDQQIFENVKEAKAELATEQEEDEGAKSPLDVLTGNPEENQEKVEANNEVIAEGSDSLLDTIKSFFGISGAEEKKDTENKKKKAKEEQSIAAQTSDFLLANQAIFGEKATKLAQGIALTDAIINQGKAISNAVASAKGTSGFDYAAQVAIAVGSALAEIVPAIGIIKGARQEGGAVTAGDAFLVGERGAEVFVPPQDGEIISNDALRQQNVNVVVTAGDEFTQGLFFNIQDQQELDQLPN